MNIKLLFLSFFLAAISVSATANPIVIEAETMTLSGSYAGQITNPFPGMALYANNDRGSISANFPSGPGNYTVSIRGASNNSNAAGVSLYINGTRVRAFTFYGTTPTVLDAELKLPAMNTGANTIALILETDNGSSDTYIDKITFTYTGPIIEKDPPVIPETGAYYSGVYRNMLKEAGYTDTQISQKLDALWNQLFYGNASTQAVYYPVGTDEAYILDTGNDDVRSEGMSYGMMICVQMNKQEEFNRLWKWSKNYMQHKTGARQGYFAWRVSKTGSIMDANTASDGEEYFIMALMFASGRWGDGEGIYNYWKEAKEMLDVCMSKENPITESITNLFNATHKQVVFTPYAQAATFTNPSYHLPSFYELWGKWIKKNRSFWKELAAKSREMFPKFAHPTTGLMPDYANFDGTPTGGSHADFRYDAWRCVMNVAMDYAWFKADNTQVTLVNRLHNFFQSKGVESYGSEYSLAGNQLNPDHSPGLVACNAAGALASNQRVAWEFIDDFFKIAIPTGKYRYYDGLLYFMNYLHLSGNYQIYTPALIEANDDPEPEPDPVNGYFVIDSFNHKETGTSLDMYKKNGASAGTAKVAVSPTPGDEKVAHVLTANWDEFIRFNATLPAGRQLSGYSHLEFDIYYNTAAAGSDNGFKDMQVYVNDVRILNEATGSTSGNNHNVWLNRSIALINPGSANSLSVYLGIRSNKANYFVDNVRLKDTQTGETIELNQQSSPVGIRNNELRMLNGEQATIRIYNTEGRKMTEVIKSSFADISSLTSGVYIARIISDGRVSHFRFIK